MLMDTMTKKKTSDERARELIEKLDSRYTLSYVDYRDTLDEKEHDKLVLDCIKENSLAPIYEAADDWYMDGQHQSVEQIIMDTFDDEEREEIWNDHEIRDAVEQAIYDRDESDTAKDLARNTGSRYFFIPLGMEVEPIEFSARTDAGAKYSDDYSDTVKKAKAIARKAKLDYAKYEKALRELVANASYGGTLGVLFRADSFIFITEGYYKKINIKGGELAIIDYNNGSGHDVRIDETLSVPFDRENIGIENYYVHDVCGMVLDEAAISFEGKTKKDISKAREPEYMAGSVGNILADSISMVHVRAWNEQKNPIGQPCEPGHLYRFDLQGWNDAPEAIREALKGGGWIAKIKQVTPTKNYTCAWIAFNYKGDKVLAQKILSDYEYVRAYIDRITSKKK